MADLFIARLPSLNNVEAFEAELVARSNGIGPPLQLLKSKCRELARSESSLLVAPTTAALHTPFGAHPPMTLWIMVQNGHISNTKFQEKLKLLGIKVMGRVSVSERLLQTCYQFSLTARLAPKWNLLTSWLVQGLEFLSTGRAHAVVLQVGVTKTDMALSVHVSKLNFNFLQPSDLEVSATILNAFTADPLSSIGENSISHNRCVLMPNLTVGYVFSAHHQLPSSTQFPTYDTVRLHWKKQHGMILPDKQNLFFQVFFKSNSRTFFSYPGCCVLKCPPTVSTSRDSRTVASSFIADVHGRMPTLCGEPIRYCNKTLTPFSHLQTATQSSNYPNVKPASNPRPASIPRPAPQPSVHGNTKSSAGIKSSCMNLIQRVSSAVIPPLKSSTHQMQTVPDVDGSTSCNESFSFNSTSQSQKQPSQVRNGLPGRAFIQNQPSSLAPPSQSVSSRNGAQMNTRIVPIFNPLRNRPSGPYPTQTDRPTKSTRTVPSFKPSTAHGAAALTSVAMKEQPQGGQSITQTHQRRLGQKHMLNEHRLPPAKQPRVMSMSCLNNTSSTSISNHSQAIYDMGLEQRVPDKSCLPVPCDDLDISRHTLHAKESDPSTKFGQHSSSNQSYKSTTQKGKGGKKTVYVDGVSEEIVREISKVKVPLLRKWLQENGVKSTSKKTKDDLIRMAAQHIRETGTTFTAPS